MRRLVALAAGLVLLAPAVAAAQLLAGAARVDVTPPPGVRMYGYGARGRNVSTGVHDPLYAKAIVLDDGARTVAWVALDLGYADKPLTRDVRAAVSEATRLRRRLPDRLAHPLRPRLRGRLPDRREPLGRGAAAEDRRRGGRGARGAARGPDGRRVGTGRPGAQPPPGAGRRHRRDVLGEPGGRADPPRRPGGRGGGVRHPRRRARRHPDQPGDSPRRAGARQPRLLPPTSPAP